MPKVTGEFPQEVIDLCREDAPHKSCCCCACNKEECMTNILAAAEEIDMRSIREEDEDDE